MTTTGKTIQVDFFSGKHEGQTPDDLPADLVTIAIAYGNSCASLATFVTLLCKLNKISEHDRLVALYLTRICFPDPEIKIFHLTQEILAQKICESSISLAANYELCEWANLTTAERQQHARINPYTLLHVINATAAEHLSLSVWNIMVVLIRLQRTDAANKLMLLDLVKESLPQRLLSRVWHRLTRR